tara:strand:+ start:306 stop:533 length:228 start_codon:yes stop_codon:yes gene_type:complete
MTEEEQKKIFDNTWDDLTAVAEKFQKASPENAPSDLVTIMIKFATVLALGTSTDSREAYNLIAEAMDSARNQISS